MSLASSRAEGFVLAGGQSSRMGRDKALLNVGGAPLIQHALRTLRRAGLEARIAGSRYDLSGFASVIPDEQGSSGSGPLAGICAALGSGNAQYAVFLPVDLPLIPADLIVYLIDHSMAAQSQITLVSEASFVQPFPVVIDRVAAPQLERALYSDDHGCLSAFCASADAMGRPVSILPIELLAAAGQVSHEQTIPAHSWFHNVNSPHDLVFAEGALSRKRFGGSVE